MKLILIRGLPGSGKSTLAEYMIDKFDSESVIYASRMGEWVHLEADMYFVKAGIYKFDATHTPEAHAWCKQQVADALVMDRNVIVSNTFTRIWEMQPYIDLAKQFGAELTVLTCEGNHGNIHGVPQETIDKMKKRWERYDG